jgi:hypothetical protein
MAAWFYDTFDTHETGAAKAAPSPPPTADAEDPLAPWGAGKSTGLGVGDRLDRHGFFVVPMTDSRYWVLCKGMSYEEIEQAADELDRCGSITAGDYDDFRYRETD